VVELEAVPLVPGVTHGLTVVPGAAPGVVVVLGEAVEGIGDAVCGIGVAVCGVGVAVLAGDCVLGAVVLGDVVTAGPGFAFGFAGFCPAVVPGVVLEPAVPVCPEERVAVCATSVEFCLEAVCPVFEAPQ
jgi:hypothetical protein